MSGTTFFGRFAYIIHCWRRGVWVDRPLRWLINRPRRNKLIK